MAPIPVMRRRLRALWPPIPLLAGALAGFGCAVDGDVLREGESAATTGAMPDACTGLDQDACTMEPGCSAIWGTPYVMNPDQGWCRHTNGLTYLGCAEATGCAQMPGTICAGPNASTYDVQLDCLPADLDAEVCEPPVENAPFC